jgi:serine/threonine protein kinase
MRNSPTIPELVRDSRLEAIFRPNASIPTATIHIKLSGRRNVPAQEVWVREKMLGHGGYGMVCLERKLENGLPTSEVRAVKQIKIHEAISAGGKYLRELEALAKFSQDKYCDSFVKSYGWYESPDPEWLFIAMEYCEHGDLKKYMSTRERLPEEEVQDLTAQILQGLVFMHENGIAHRDLKPAVRTKPHLVFDSIN